VADLMANFILHYLKNRSYNIVLHKNLIEMLFDRYIVYSIYTKLRLDHRSG